MARSRLNKDIAILLSGGIDSAALAFWQKPAFAIYINYGQKCAEAEFTASQAIAKAIGMRFTRIDCDLSSLGSGDLSESKALSIAPVSEWWPYRNQMLVTLGAMKAVSFGVTELLVGAVKTDKRHVDGTNKFFRRLNSLVSLQEGGMTIKVPAISNTTLQLIELSKIPYSILGWSHSCHTSNLPCGHCNGCNKHFSIKQHLGILN